MATPLYSIPGAPLHAPAAATVAAEPTVAVAGPAPDAPRTVAQVLATSQVMQVLDQLDQELVGLAPVNDGVLIDLLPQHALRPCRGARLQPLPPGASLDGHPPPAELLESHRALGCLPMVLHDAQGSQLLVVQRTRVRGLPAAKLVYADSNQRWRQQLGLLARHLLAQGMLCLVSDRRPGMQASGAIFRPRDIWFCRGDGFEDRTDLLGSELCLLPW
jgi:hypothetical protein